MPTAHIRRGALRLLTLLLAAALVLAGTGLAQALSWPLWGGDQTTNPIANTYGQYQDYSPDRYAHPGVDLKAMAGTVVVAGTYGMVTNVYLDPDPAIRYRDGLTVTDAAGTHWAYWHIDRQSIQVAVGDTITDPDEQRLADIYDYAPGWNHLHLGNVKAPAQPDLGAKNPLRDLPYTDSLAPTVQKDGFRFQPNLAPDNTYFLKQIPGTALGSLTQDATWVGRRADISGGGSGRADIDCVVAAYDQIDDSPYHVGLYRMGYEIHPAGYLPAAAGVEHHWTFRFERELPDQKFGMSIMTLYKDDAICDSAGKFYGPSETLGQGTFWHIVTNTTDTSAQGDPDSGGLSAPASWVTRGGAAVNALAPSPDGDYTVEVTAEDIAGNLTTGYGRARVDNFEQLAGVRPGSSNPFIEPPIYDTNRFCETARIDPYPARIGDDIDTKAKEMLGDVDVTAWLVPHRDWWYEGDLLSTNFITFGIYHTDALGTVDWSWIWKADRMGTFDILFDYDSSGTFSFSLDPLIGFHVVPEPLTAAGVAMSLWLLAGYTRRRAR